MKLQDLIQRCNADPQDPNRIQAIVKYIQVSKGIPNQELAKAIVRQVLEAGIVASRLKQLSLNAPADPQQQQQLLSCIFELCNELTGIAVSLHPRIKYDATKADEYNNAIQACMPLARDSAVAITLVSALGTMAAVQSLHLSLLQELRVKLITQVCCDTGASAAAAARPLIFMLYKMPVFGSSEAVATVSACLAADCNVLRALLMQLEAAVAKNNDLLKKTPRAEASTAVRMLAGCITSLCRELVNLISVILEHGSKSDVDALLALMATLPQDAELMSCASRCLTVLDAWRIDQITKKHQRTNARDANVIWALFGSVVCAVASSLAFVSGGSTATAMTPTYWLPEPNKRKLNLVQLSSLMCANQPSICEQGILLSRLADAIEAPECKRDVQNAVAALLVPMARSLRERLNGKTAKDALKLAKRFHDRVLRMVTGLTAKGATLKKASLHDSSSAAWQLMSGLCFLSSTGWSGDRGLLLVRVLKTLVRTVQEYLLDSAAGEDHLGSLVTIGMLVDMCRKDWVAAGHGLPLPAAVCSIVQLSSLGLRLAARSQSEPVARFLYEVGRLLSDGAGSAQEHAGRPEMRAARLAASAATGELVTQLSASPQPVHKNVTQLLVRVLSQHVVVACRQAQQTDAAELDALLRSLAQHRVAMNRWAHDGANDDLGAMHVRACLVALVAGLDQQRVASATLAALCSQLVPPAFQYASALTLRHASDGQAPEQLLQVLEALLLCVLLLQRIAVGGANEEQAAAIRVSLEAGLPALLAAMLLLRAHAPLVPQLVSAVKELHASVGGCRMWLALVVPPDVAHICVGPEIVRELLSGRPWDKISPSVRRRSGRAEQRPDLAELMSVLRVPGCHNPMCRRCEAAEQPTRMLCCRGCLKVRYCSEACAREAWTGGHGMSCENVVKIRRT